MSLHPRRFVLVIGSLVLTAGLFTPDASAVSMRVMGPGGMQSMRPNGMVGNPVMNHFNSLNGFSMNPYLNLLRMSHFPMNSYGMPYSGSGGNGGYPMMMSYGQYAPQTQPAGPAYQPNQSGDGYASSSKEQTSESTLRTAKKDQLTSLRLFAGGLAWPQALRYFTNDGNLKELREGIDRQIESVLNKQDGQSVPESQLAELKRDVANLRKRFEGQAYDLPMTSQQETDARRFLAKLKSALEQVPPGKAASGGSKQ
jgi:hypothetical protein